MSQSSKVTERSARTIHVHQGRAVQKAQLSLTNRPTLVHAGVRISLTKKRYEAQLFILCCQELFSDEGLRFSSRIFRLLPTLLPFDAISGGDHLKLSGSCLVRENQNGWVTIWWRFHSDRLSRLGTIHQRGIHTKSHVTIANAAPRLWCDGR